MCCARNKLLEEFKSVASVRRKHDTCNSPLCRLLMTSSRHKDGSRSVGTAHYSRFIVSLQDLHSSSQFKTFASHFLTTRQSQPYSRSQLKRRTQRQRMTCIAPFHLQRFQMFPKHCCRHRLPFLRTPFCIGVVTSIISQLPARTRALLSNSKSQSPSRRHSPLVVQHRSLLCIAFSFAQVLCAVLISGNFRVRLMVCENTNPFVALRPFRRRPWLLDIHPVIRKRQCQACGERNRKITPFSSC